MGNKITKRIVCLLLSFAMVFTSVVTGDVATVKASDYSNDYNVKFFTQADMTNPVWSIDKVVGDTVTIYSNHALNWSIDQTSYASFVGYAGGLSTSVTVKVTSALGSNVNIRGYYYNEERNQNISDSFKINTYDDVNFTDTDLTIKQNYTKDFNVNDHSGKFFTYSIDNLNIFEFDNPAWATRTFNKYITLKAKNIGTANLTVTAFADSEGNIKLSQKTITITVTEAPFYLFTDSRCKDEDVAAPSYDMSVGRSKNLYFYSNVFKVSETGVVSSNPAVVTATKSRWNDNTITIEAVGNGTAVVSVTNLFGQTASVTINVHTDAESISFTEDKYYLNKGYSVQTAYVLKPANAQANVTYESTNTKVCTISPTGVITGVGEGSCRVKVIAGNHADYANVEVVGPSVNINKSSIYVGEKAYATFSGGEGVRWTSSNTKVATVDANGVITGKKKGSVSIIGTSSAGTQALAVITISNPSLSATKLKMYIKTTDKLKMYGGSGTIKWSTSNKKVATVDKKGKITAKKKGTCYIYATRNGVKLKCKVTVKNPELSRKKLTTYNNAETYLYVRGGKGKTKWSSSNKKVATVSKSGKITAKKTGSCTITAKRNGITLKCKVTVKKNQYNFYNTVSPSAYYGVQFVPKKVYYSGNSIVVEAYIVNAQYRKINKFTYLTVYVKSRSGYTTIASKTFYNYKASIKAKAAKKVKFKLSGSYVYDKHYVLNDGISCTAQGYYLYD